jgi:(p)ppGpp synthase/HD superfamily hydrolase
LFSDEIYVYTPTNEFITLPINSTPLDFAYKIHSEIGNHFVGAKVNGRMVPIDYRLRNGDKIEVIVSNKAKPEDDWLNYVITSKASNEIQKFFKEEERRKEQIGRDRWKKELDRRKFFIDNNRLLNILAEFNINNLTDFFISIADESLDVSSFAEFVVDSLFNSEREKVAIKDNIIDEEISNPLNQLQKEETTSSQDKIFADLNENIKKFALSFTGKENYSLISQISQLILNTKNIILTKFVYDLEKNKINGEIQIESEDEEAVKSLFENIKKIPGISYVNEFYNQ